MLDNGLVIHFQPGARGDFLAALLTETFRSKPNGAVSRAPGYTKVHYDFDPQPYQNQLRIRIDDNGLIDNLMQITYNSMIKNPLESYHDINAIDHFYVRVIDCLSKDRSDPADYDYWIDFQFLNDAEWLKSFFKHVHKRLPDAQVWNFVENNLQQQETWHAKEDLQKLSLLIDYERRFKLFAWHKTFTVNDIICHPNPQSLLCHSNYSQQPFGL